MLVACAKALASLVPLRISVNHFYRCEQLIDDPVWVERISRDPLIGPARRLSIAVYRSLIEDWDGPAAQRTVEHLPAALAPALGEAES